MLLEPFLEGASLFAEVAIFSGQARAVSMRASKLRRFQRGGAVLLYQPQSQPQPKPHNHVQPLPCLEERRTQLENSCADDSSALLAVTRRALHCW